MGQIRKVVLDVLKPHKPSILELANELSDTGDKCIVNVSVLEVDEQTETLVVTLTGNSINLDDIAKKITDLGGTIHSIDEVEASSEP